MVGYEAGVRVWTYLGRSHYQVFHTTGTAGTLAAAAAVAHLLGTDKETMLHAFGSAGTQAAGLWEFLRDAADSKQLHTAKAAAEGLLEAMQEHRLAAEQIEHVRARVHQAAIDVLGSVTDPRTIHQSKFSMGFVLALIALYGRAGTGAFTEEALHNPEIRELRDRVEMVFDPEIDEAYPDRWIGLVDVKTTAGDRFTSRVEVPKGDPGNTLSRAEIEDKAGRLTDR